MTQTYFPNGRYFEDFTLGETLVHATPRTLGEGDGALYQALYGGRNPLHSSAPFAQQLGLRDRPLEDWLVFHIVFGKSVPDVSRHALANLGYGEGQFGAPVFAGDTLSASSQVIGLRENKSGETGIVMVRTRGVNQHEAQVLSYVRWVMVKKRDASSPAPNLDPKTAWPDIAAHVGAADLPLPQADYGLWNCVAAGSPRLWESFEVGEKMAHGGGVTLEDSEHMMATRAYQNTAEVHFDAHLQADSRFGQRLIYGGHIISHATAMRFNGFENAGAMATLNSGTHAAPAFAGDTIYGWSEVLDKASFETRPDVGALRLRQIMIKGRKGLNINDFPHLDAESKRLPEVILELDIWLYMARG
jgi:2-methylfumaryl-CoA hydratase